MTDLKRSEWNDDRTVHAAYDGIEIVRYNRAGRWYAEPTDGGKRTQLTIRKAAQLAVQGEQTGQGTIRFHLPGGDAFERHVIRTRAAVTV